MIHWRDMTFCNGNCANRHCPRHWSVVEENDHDGWPIAQADFSSACEEYQKPEKKAGV